MSFSIYVSAFKDAEPYFFPSAVLRERFSKHMGAKDEFNFAPLSFDGNERAGEIHFEDGGTIDGFSVLRPPGNREFWEVIAGILRDLPCVIYWGGGAVMGSLDMLNELPDAIVEKLGVPLVSTDAEQIRQYVRDNS